jgi:methionyl-tRNA synthetase
VPANEFLNLQGRKLSTSKNYAVWLDDYLDKFPADPLRYYLAVNAPETKDSDFTWSDFQQRNNSELADILGNFINRTLAFADRNFNHKVPPLGELDNGDRAMIEELASTPKRIAFFYERYQFRRAVSALMDLARSCNKYFNDQEPWRVLKSDRTACATSLHICLSACRTLAVLMAPVMPFSAEKVLAMLGLQQEINDLHWSGAGELVLPAGQRLGEITILFDKIENKQIEAEIIRLKKIAEQLGEEPVEQPISIEEFARTELRVARVVSAESVPKADKLLKLIVEIEGEERQIVAGIAQYYSPEQLINRKIVVVTNLKPAHIRGIESNGMLLAAESETGELSLLALDRDMPSGSRIR